MVNSMQLGNAKVTLDKRANEDWYKFTLTLIVEIKQRLSEGTSVNVVVATNSQQYSMNLSDIVCVSSIQFEVDKLRAILEDDSPVAPLDSCPRYVIVASFR